MTEARTESVATVGELVAAWAHCAPCAPALVAPGRQSLTYGILLEQLQRTTSTLAQAGVSPRDRVAILLPNGPELATAILAVASYGVCAPLNPAYGAEALRSRLRELHVKTLILRATDPGPARSVARELGVDCLDASWENCSPAGHFMLSERENRSYAAIPLRVAEEVALVLHTSGTISRPKTVLLTQRNLCCSAANIASSLRLEPRDCCLNAMPLYHVHGLVGALLASLWAGASIECLPEMQAATFLNRLTELEATWYTGVPAMHASVLEEFSRRPVGKVKHHLRFVRSCSAPLPRRVAGELEAAFGVPVIEAYGMTETTHQMTSNPVPPLPRKPGSVGIATGVDVAIMGENGRLCAIAGRGEIVVRGDTVISGYETNPQANRAAFVDGWFHTGDLGQLDSEGYLTISGRLKEIINRGGEKVAPREVEEALLEHAAVRRCAAFAVSHPTLGEDVAAAVVLREGASGAEGELRKFLFGRLPDFAIPSRVLIVPEIPIGPTGKIQRIGLAEHFSAHLRPAFVAPRSDTEVFVARLFSEVLGVELVGATDNFFALGGDSLRGMQLLVRLQAVRGVGLPPAALFMNPTIVEFARQVEAAAAGSFRAATVPPRVRGTRPSL